MSSSSRLARQLFGQGDRPLEEVAVDARLLARRLLLAEILAPPPALREPGQASPLSPRTETPCGGE